MRSTVRGRTVWAAGAVLLASVGLMACDKVTPPDTDDTPPIVTWTVQNLTTNDSQTIVGSGTVMVHDGDQFLVILRAEDPEGLLELALSSAPGTTKDCTKGEVTEHETGDAFGGKEQVLHPDAQGKVPTASIMDTRLGWVCELGWTLTGGGGSVKGTGTNVHGAETAGQVKFTVALDPLP